MTRITPGRLLLCGTILALVVVLCLPLVAQTTQKMEVRRGTVVYVSGHDVVVRMDDGTVRHVTVPPDATFTVAGKTMGVADLKPGMELTKTVTTTTTNRTVSSFRTVSGTVWQVNAPYVIITVDGKNRQVKVPDDTKFDIDGQKLTVFELKKGMKFTATVATEVPETVVASTSRVTGTAPPPPPAPVVEPPRQVTTLVVEEAPPPKPMRAAATEPAPTPAPEPAAPPARLPSTASPVPLVGLMGLLSLSTGLALRSMRKR